MKETKTCAVVKSLAISRTRMTEEIVLDLDLIEYENRPSLTSKC